MNDTLDPVLQRFEAAAMKFIACVDSASTLERDVFLANVGLCLAELYYTALEIPVVEPESESPDDTPFPVDQWQEQYRVLREKIGDADLYWTVLIPTENEEPVQGSLAGDISEIYYDLKQDLRLKETRIAYVDFVWEVRFSFREHWGRHAIGALKTIYELHLDDAETFG